MEFNLWSPYKYITALTSTREGGVSRGAYAKLNLAYHVGDNQDDVATNRQLLLDELQLSSRRIITTYQSHSDVIKKVTLTDGGRGAESFESGIAADALYTYDNRLALAIFHADCVPVFLFDKVKKWVAIIHAGMAGSLKGITEKSIAHLIKMEGSHPENIFAYLGPSLTFAHNPIEEKTMTSILALNPDFHYAIKKSDGIYYLDVPLLNYGQLRKSGVPAANITNSGIDTYSDPDRYFSFARETTTGRHLSIIFLNR
ncbi:MAG TPA: peptidoglycan editing factor PgeF [Bacilli bacterium]|nr:peptidoglycan editing factor PgeF [Bacilli bacterium]